MLWQCDRRQHGPPGVIFLRHGCPEERLETIAREVRDGALTPLHHLLGQGELGLHQGVHRLGAQAHRQGRGLSQATAEHRDRLMLAFRSAGGSAAGLGAELEGYDLAPHLHDASKALQEEGEEAQREFRAGLIVGRCAEPLAR
jgi:hypothetical protein